MTYRDWIALQNSTKKWRVTGLHVKVDNIITTSTELGSVSGVVKENTTFNEQPFLYVYVDENYILPMIKYSPGYLPNCAMDCNIPSSQTVGELPRYKAVWKDPGYGGSDLRKKFKGMVKDMGITGQHIRAESLATLERAFADNNNPMLWQTRAPSGDQSKAKQGNMYFSVFNTNNVKTLRSGGVFEYSWKPHSSDYLFWRHVNTPVVGIAPTDGALLHSSIAGYWLTSDLTHNQNEIKQWWRHPPPAILMRPPPVYKTDGTLVDFQFFMNVTYTIDIECDSIEGYIGPVEYSDATHYEFYNWEEKTISKEIPSHCETVNPIKLTHGPGNLSAI